MTDKIDINPNRLKFARKRRGVTIRAVSEKAGISSRLFSDYENGRKSPYESTLAEIAGILRFPIQFFLLDDIAELCESAVSFRSLARMPAYVRDAAISAGRIALELNAWIDNKFDMPEVALPDLRGYEPETASKTIRELWGFGEQPIQNLVHLLEAKGVRVFSLDESTYDMDAYSFWMGDRPFIFLNTRKSVERSRFDAAHELGHLVLHKHGTPMGKEAETEANNFASALLMPSGSVIANAPRFVTLDWAINAKSFWIVSAAALIRRLKDLHLLTEWRYRSLTVELSQRGYLKNEPNPAAPRETSKLLPMVFNALREDGLTKEDIAKELCVFTEEIDSLIFNLAMTSIPGGMKSGASYAGRTKDAWHLTVIK